MTVPRAVPSRAPGARLPVTRVHRRRDRRTERARTGAAHSSPSATRSAPRSGRPARTMRGAPGPSMVSRSESRTRPRSRCSPHSCVMPARRRATKEHAARPNQRHEHEAAEPIAWLVSAACVRGVIATRASRIRRAAAGPPSRVRGAGPCSCCCRRRWRWLRGKRLDQDAMQHGADRGAPAVGAPRFPHITDPLGRGDVAHHRGRSGQPVIFPPRGADVVLGALPDIQPVGPVDDPAGIVAAGNPRPRSTSGPR